MTKQGFQAIGTDLYSYYEISAGGSTASGLDNDDGDKYKIAASAVAGANPSGTAQFVIDPAVNGNIDLTPNGTGEVNISKVDIDSGAIDGTTVGANVASTGVFTQVDSDNIRLDGNTIFSTDANGDIVLQPDGTGDLKINNGANDTFIMRDTGACTMPYLPCFNAYTVDQFLVTGDGTVYTVTFTGGEDFDQGGNFASPTFTAPVTGNYFFNSLIFFDDIGAGTTSGYISLVTTGGTYTGGRVHPSFIDSGVGISYTSNISMIVAMIAGNTAIIQVCLSGDGKVVDVRLNATFDGTLVC